MPASSCPINLLTGAQPPSMPPSHNTQSHAPYPAHRSTTHSLTHSLHACMRVCAGDGDEHADMQQRSGTQQAQQAGAAAPAPAPPPSGPRRGFKFIHHPAQDYSPANPLCVPYHDKRHTGPRVATPGASALPAAACCWVGLATRLHVEGAAKSMPSLCRADIHQPRALPTSAMSACGRVAAQVAA